MSVLIGVVAGCDPMIGSGISVGPTPAAGAVARERNVLGTVASVARRNGMSREDNIEHVEDEGWLECYGRGGVRLCAKAGGATTQLLLTDFPSFRFPHWADSLRRELLDSLRARFDSQSVRECKWDTNTNVCAEARPVHGSPIREPNAAHASRATNGTTSFIFDGNRVYALVSFLLPNGSTHAAYVDLGTHGDCHAVQI